MLFIFVDTPVVTIQNSTFYYFLPGQSYQLHCESKGFPTPSLSWGWKSLDSGKACESVPCDSNGEWTTIDDTFGVNNVTQWLMDVDEENVWSILTLMAHTSGYLRCVSKNEIGMEKEEMPFIVTGKDNYIYSQIAI